MIGALIIRIGPLKVIYMGSFKGTIGLRRFGVCCIWWGVGVLRGPGELVSRLEDNGVTLIITLLCGLGFGVSGLGLYL